MDKQRQLISVLVLLIIIMGWVWFPVIKEMFVGGLQQSEEALVGSSVTQIDFSKPMRALYAKKEWGRNPFLSLQAINLQKQQALSSKNKIEEVQINDAVASSIDPTKRFTLNGTFLNQQRPSALINNEFVIEGQRIEEFIVTAIKSDHVVLMLNEQTFQLFMNK